MGSAKAQRIAFFSGVPAMFVGVTLCRLAWDGVTAPVQAEPVVVDCGAPPRELPQRTWVRLHGCRVVEEHVLEVVDTDLLPWLFGREVRLVVLPLAAAGSAGRPTLYLAVSPDTELDASALREGIEGRVDALPPVSRSSQHLLAPLPVIHAGRGGAGSEGQGLVALALGVMIAGIGVTLLALAAIWARRERARKLRELLDGLPDVD